MYVITTTPRAWHIHFIHPRFLFLSVSFVFLSLAISLSHTRSLSPFHWPHFQAHFKRIGNSLWPTINTQNEYRSVTKNGFSFNGREKVEMYAFITSHHYTNTMSTFIYVKERWIASMVRSTHWDTAQHHFMYGVFLVIRKGR